MTIAAEIKLSGYGLRIVPGYFSDKTKRYRTITIIGYLLNLFPGHFVVLPGLRGKLEKSAK